MGRQQEIYNSFYNNFMSSMGMGGMPGMGMGMGGMGMGMGGFGGSMGFLMMPLNYDMQIIQSIEMNQNSSESIKINQNQ